MNWRTKAAAALSSVALGLGLAMVGAGPAHAQNLVQAQAKEQVWSYTFKVEDVPGTLNSSQTFTVTLYTNYWRWNTGNGIKIAPFGYAACYDTYQNPKGWFDGVKLNPIYHDSNETVNPAGIKIDRSGMHGCAYHDILPSARKWLEMGQNPWAQAAGSVVYNNGGIDKGYTMRTADYGQGTVYRLFQPSADETYANQVVDTDSITAR